MNHKAATQKMNQHPQNNVKGAGVGYGNQNIVYANAGGAHMTPAYQTSNTVQRNPNVVGVGSNPNVIASKTLVNPNGAGGVQPGPNITNFDEAAQHQNQMVVPTSYLNQPYDYKGSQSGDTSVSH